MSEKKVPESPFSKNQLEFQPGKANKSFPAMRPDDKRRQNDASHLLKGNVPGVNGNIQRKPLAEALRKKIEERAAADGKTFADFWAELVLKDSSVLIHADRGTHHIHLHVGDRADNDVLGHTWNDWQWIFHRFLVTFPTSVDVGRGKIQ